MANKTPSARLRSRRTRVASGGYSLGTTLAEGLSQLSIVFRTNFSPLLTRYLAEGRDQELRSLFRKGKRAGYLAVGGVGAVAILLFPYVVGFVTRNPDFRQSWLVFAILTGGHRDGRIRPVRPDPHPGGPAGMALPHDPGGRAIQCPLQWALHPHLGAGRGCCRDGFGLVLLGGTH
jgi:hypothetical protein